MSAGAGRAQGAGADGRWTRQRRPVRAVVMHVDLSSFGLFLYLVSERSFFHLLANTQMSLREEGSRLYWI